MQAGADLFSCCRRLPAALGPGPLLVFAWAFFWPYPGEPAPERIHAECELGSWKDAARSRPRNLHKPQIYARTGSFPDKERETRLIENTVRHRVQIIVQHREHEPRTAD